MLPRLVAYLYAQVILLIQPYKCLGLQVCTIVLMLKVPFLKAREREERKEENKEGKEGREEKREGNLGRYGWIYGRRKGGK